MAAAPPPFRGQFDHDPRDPALDVELLVLERAIGNPSGAWSVSGAITRPPAGPAAWVGDPDEAYGESDAEQVWAYLSDKGGGNGYTFEVAFLWIAAVEDAPQVVAHVAAALQHGHPLGAGLDTAEADPANAPVSTADPAADPARDTRGQRPVAKPREQREAFARDNADKLAYAAMDATMGGARLLRVPPQAHWTTRAVWYQDNDTLLAVVGEQERADTDIVLAHGLHLAAGRTLRLVLPDAWAAPTRHRIPWLTADVHVSTYQPGQSPQPAERWTKIQTCARAGGPETSPSLHLGPNAHWVRDLVEWATAHRDLDAAHTRSVRNWSCHGQRVLTISGKSAFRVTAGIDATIAKADPLTVDGPMSLDTLTRVQALVEAGIENAEAKTFGQFEEHHLQVVLRRDPRHLRLEHPLLREVPAWRPSGGDRDLGRGYVDLAGLDPAGDIVIVETKLAADEMLVLQGLDYWIWATAQANHDWLVRRLHADPAAPTRLLYAVGGKRGSRPVLGKYARTHFTLLDPAIPWRVALLEEWQGDDPQADVLPPRTL